MLAAGGVLVMGLAAEPTWHLARAPGSGCWPPDCADGQVPLATPIVVHRDRLVMIGDAAPTRGYESSDGTTWRVFTHDAGWGKRYKSADISYGGALWRIGGWVEEDGVRTAKNDVWRSEDGRHWVRVLAAAPWPPRSGAHLVAFRDTLWLIGGEPADQRLWLTTDGRHWVARAATSLPAENPQGVLVYNDALWVIGHGEWESATNDVWSSSDGLHWSRVSAHAPWPVRTCAGFAVLGDRLWVVAGAGFRDAWSSSDGRSWRRASTAVPGPTRCAEYSVVFQNAYWIFGGKTGGAGGTGFWDGIITLK